MRMDNSDRVPAPTKDLTGLSFDRLTVLNLSGYLGVVIAYDCLCRCGIKVRIRGTNLTNGHTKSCGCAQQESRCAPRKHGGSGTPEHRIWKDMRRRCRNPKNKRFKDYGGRGITICERWGDFAKFREDMGRRPSPSHTLDRKDNDGHYTPENCRWATPLEQANNTRGNRYITHGDITMTLSQWERHLRLPSGTVRQRLWNGWSEEMALTTPIKQRNLSP